MSPVLEPSGELRMAAAFLRQMYVALTQEGFTPTEAMQIVAIVLKAQMDSE
jgi:hypothetical protein